MAHQWKFFRAGGFDQVLLESGDDLVALGSETNLLEVTALMFLYPPPLTGGEVVIEFGVHCACIIKPDQTICTICRFCLDVSRRLLVCLDLFTAAAKCSRNIPVIALTAFAMPEEQERFMSDGFDGYISKPVEIGVLVGEIERVMGLKVEG